MVWPSPEPVTLTLFSGAITSPAHVDAATDEWQFEEPEAAAPWPICELRPADSQTNSRGDWSARTEAVTAMRSDATHFHISGLLKVWEGDTPIFERQFNKTVDRRLL